MATVTRTPEQLAAENAALRRRLEEAEETIAAIRQGTVDAFFVGGAGEERVYTLETADRPYRMFVEAMRQGAVTLDGNGVLLFCNEAFAGLVGQPHTRLMGSRFTDLLPPEDRPAWDGLWRGAQRGELRLRRGDGAAVPVYLSMSRLPLTAAAAYWAVVTDLTEQKHYEELQIAQRALQEADRRKDDFLAMLAHELRNPLGPIRNAVQILNAVGFQNDDARQARAMIDRQVAHMARLIDDLLDVSRIARGKILLRKEPCDLAQIVRQTVEDYRGTLEGSGLKLSARLPGEALWLDGDCTRLAQVVGNVLHNANKFTERGGQVVVTLARGADGGAEVRVRDTGIGMAPEMLARVFETFSQADNSLDRSRGGLGLGLALVKGLVELHGGSVAAASDGPGRGTEVTLRLPLAPPAAATAGTPDAAGASKTCRVLVIEDHRDAAESMRMLLGLAGHRVEVAYSGKDGVERARGFRPDVVLCDIGLPGGLDGFGVARQLRREGVRARLVALSGYGQDEDQRRAYESGFDLHFTKPIDYADLQRALAGA